MTTEKVFTKIDEAISEAKNVYPFANIQIITWKEINNQMCFSVIPASKNLYNFEKLCYYGLGKHAHYDPSA